MANATFLLKLIVLPLICIMGHGLRAQQTHCIYDEPFLKIDFGNIHSPMPFKLTSLPSYNKVKGVCPNDGDYTIASYSMNCFNGNWHNLMADHTAGDQEGRMMIVNASIKPGPFFIVNIAGMKPGKAYQLVSWLVNICRSGQGCTPTPPSLSFSILCNGKLVKKFTTGEIAPTSEPQWKQYAAFFTMPENEHSITLQIDDMTNGGCGNDFAIDDISLLECTMQQTAIEKKPEPTKTTTKPQQEIFKEKKPAAGPVKVPPAPAPTTQKKEPVLKKLPEETTPILSTPEPGKTTRITTLPKPIADRANPLIKRIETEAADLLLELYDNGQVDGDTVSIYHNNHLLLSHAALTDKPLQIKIQLDALHPHHELIMVADNLGSIPPNTSLMILTTKNKRYEIFISSSEQKNAKIVIDLKE
ncbi:MAG: hypothetical protein H7X88_03010 [Gloeobacteraceae cyanobacterium ES-bin-316]|nr:hypothetical protein [Ferruginibacter sp.]